MPITQAELDHLCRLAHLALTPDESARMRAEISSVLDHIETMQQADTAGVSLTVSALPPENVLRPDTVTPSWSAEGVLANAPRRQDDLFEVQAIFD